jgi:hypothetical protein
MFIRIIKTRVACHQKSNSLGPLEVAPRRFYRLPTLAIIWSQSVFSEANDQTMAVQVGPPEKGQIASAAVDLIC